MPEKITSITDMSIDFVSFVIVLFALLNVMGAIVSSYAIFIIKSLKKGISDLKNDTGEKISDLKEDTHEDIVDLKKKNTKVFDKMSGISERLAKAETNISNFKKNH